MEKQEILNIVNPIVGNYKMTAKISGNNQVIIIDSKNRFAGWIDTDNKRVVAKYQGSKVLLGSLVRNALVQALNYNYCDLRDEIESFFDEIKEETEE